MPAWRVEVVQSIASVKREEWNALLTEHDAPVLRWEWLDALESSGSATKRKGWEPAHFLLHDGEKLIAAAPAWLKHHSMGEYVYDFAWANAAAQFGVSYYPKLLVGVPLSPLTARRFITAPGVDAGKARAALLEAVRALAKSEGLSSVHVIFPPEEEAAELQKLGLFRRVGMQYHWRNAHYRDWDDFLSRFDSKRRNQLKREKGAAEKQGIVLRTVAAPELSVEHARIAYRCYESTVAKNGWGQVQLNREFFERAFKTLSEHIELVTAEKGAGHVIAGAFNLKTPKRLYGRYWGCFEEHPFLHFNVCLYHSVEACIRVGREVFEPGAGGEHKISRGFVPTQIHSAHEIFEKRFAKAVQAFCERERAEVLEVTARGEEISGLKPR